LARERVGLPVDNADVGDPVQKDRQFSCELNERIKYSRFQVINSLRSFQPQQPATNNDGVLYVISRRIFDDSIQVRDVAVDENAAGGGYVFERCIGREAGSGSCGEDTFIIFKRTTFGCVDEVVSRGQMGDSFGEVVSEPVGLLLGIPGWRV
jgi:hypothetical protein